MGHFFPPPPPQIVAANATQPFAPPKLPPSLAVVPNPPFRHPGRKPEIVAENAAIAQPDPWTYTFEARQPGQPYGPATLPPSTLIVPNPPFINANKSPTAIWQMEAIGQPDPWVYAFQGFTGFQPYAPNKLPPSQLIVPNPPFVNANKSPTAIWQNSVFGQPDPWPYVFISATGAQPYGPLKSFPISTVVVVTQTPYSNAWVATVLASWIAPDPPPTLPRQLSPGIPGQSVDNPPGLRNRFDWLNWQSPDPSIQSPRYVPQAPVVVTTQGPYANLWLATIVQSWFSPDPAPTLPRYLNPFFTAVPVNNPPPYSIAGLSAILGGWQPPDPPPTLPRQLSPGIPGQSVDNPPGLYVSVPFEIPDVLPQQPRPVFTPSGAVVVVSQTPYSNAWVGTVIQSWFAPDPAPTLPRNLAPSQLIVPNPPFVAPSQLPNILAEWQPPDPPPSLPGKLSPGIPGQSVDNPPLFTRFQPPYPADNVAPQQQIYGIPQTTIVVTTQGPYNNTWLASVIQSWFGADPLPTLPRYLPPVITAVEVDNPPFSHYGRSAWVAQIAVLAWQPPDPLPTLSGKLNPSTLAVPVNNPPFTGRTELPGILAAWSAWPPQPLPTPSASAPQVQPGPPPPPITAQFTVSGPDVSQYLPEFGYDVVYTDAPITKRTV